MAANGFLNFQGTKKATFVGTNSNVVINTLNSSLGIGVDENGPTSNLHVVGNAYVSTGLTVGGTTTATAFAGPLTGAVTGDGSGLTALNATNIASGTLTAARIPDIWSNLASNVVRITTLETDVTDNASRITTLETDVTDNASRITTLESANTVQGGLITAIETDVASNASKIAFVTSTVDTTSIASNLSVTGNLTVLGTTTTVDTDNLRVKDPIIELGKDNTASPIVDLGLILTRPTGNSNVAIIFDESTDKLEIGYTQGNALDTDITMQTAAANPISVNVNGTISGDGSGLTALNATNIASGTLDAARIPILNQNTTGSAGSAATLTTPRSIGGVNFDGSVAIVPTTFNGATFSGDVTVDSTTFHVDSTNNRVGIGTASPDTKLNMKSGVFLAENQASTNGMVLYDDAGGSGGTNNNQYTIGDAKLGVAQFVNDTGTTGSTITLMNKELADNTTKHTSIGFVNTDTSGNGKFGGQIGFWPESGNVIKQQFRIYTSGASAGYNLPVQRMVVDGDGNVGIGMIDPGAKLDVNGSIRGAYDTNTTSYFGRAAIGYSGHSDWGGFSHLDCNNSTDYCLLQNNTGITELNCKSDKYIQFNCGNAAKMRMTADGDFGIGDTTPSSKLDVNGSIRGAYNTDTTSYFGRSAVGYVGHSDWAGFAHLDRNNTSDYALLQNSDGRTIINCKSDQHISFSSGDNTKMRVLANGNVGIGTTSPDKAKLQINNTLALLNPSYKSASDDDQLAGKIEFYLGGSSNELSTPVAAIEGYDKYAGGSYAGALALKVHGGEKMRILSNGNVGIGTSTPGYKLDIKANSFGHLGLLGSSSGRYSISTTYNGGSMMFTHGSYSWGLWANAHHYDVYSGRSGYNLTGSRDFYLNYYSGAPVRLVNGTAVSSDDRIKTNERYITNATETLLKLKPQIYDKGPSLGGGTGETRVESGLIVQDIYYDAPELRHLVHYDEDAEIPDEKPYVDDDPQKDPDYSMWGTKSAGLNYEGFIAYLIKSNQEIYTELQAEKARNDSLEARILALENA